MNVMTIEKPETKATDEQAATDARIGQVVQVIVHEFKGDPGAYFDSIRRKKKPKESEDREAWVVRRFVKSM